MSPTLAAKPTVATASTVRPSTLKLLKRCLDLHAQKAQIEKEIKELDAEVLPLIIRAGGTVETDDWKALKVDSTSTHISKELLLTAGVKPSVIAKCTISTPYSYPRFYLKNEDQS